MGVLSPVGAQRVSPLGGVRRQRGHRRAGPERRLLSQLGQHARGHAAAHRLQGGLPGVCEVSLKLLSLPTCFLQFERQQFFQGIDLNMEF